VERFCLGAYLSSRRHWREIEKIRKNEKNPCLSYFDQLPYSYALGRKGSPCAVVHQGFVFDRMKKHFGILLAAFVCWGVLTPHAKAVTLPSGGQSPPAGVLAHDQILQAHQVASYVEGGFVADSVDAKAPTSDMLDEKPAGAANIPVDLPPGPIVYPQKPSSPVAFPGCASGNSGSYQSSQGGQSLAAMAENLRGVDVPRLFCTLIDESVGVKASQGAGLFRPPRS
jgi:hypothetical protein